MNKVAMLKLADALENCVERKNFNMSSFVDAPNQRDDAAGEVLLSDMKEKGCGTTCCIAGWAYLLKHKRVAMSYGCDQDGVPGEAQRILGLTEEQADNLFYEDMSQTNKQAAQKIRRMVEKQFPGAVEEFNRKKADKLAAK